MRHEAAPIGKIHSNVQQMLAEAREIIKPNHKMQSMLASSNSHLEIHLPTNHVSDHLKEILHLPSQSYRKIERQRRRSLIKLEGIDKSEDYSARKSIEQPTTKSPLLLTRLTDRYQLKSIINNFESELVDKRFHQNIHKHRRPLYNKNTINLLPEVSELPLIKSHSKSLQKVQESLDDKNSKPSSKIYLTITEDDLIKARSKKKMSEYRTIEETYPKMLRQLIQLSSSRLKRINKPKQGQTSIISQKKVEKRKKSKQKNVQAPPLPEQQKYEPWLIESQEPQLNF